MEIQATSIAPAQEESLMDNAIDRLRVLYKLSDDIYVLFQEHLYDCETDGMREDGIAQTILDIHNGLDMVLAILKIVKKQNNI